MKFGGAVLKNPEIFSSLADLILERKKEYFHIVVVVSAMSGMTDNLISLAFRINPSPPEREYDMLVSAGERISISLLAMALAAKGVDAVSFTGSQSGILTTNQHREARILSVRPERLILSLNQGKIVIVAGFQGVSQNKEITTLGRGGSDTSAVALGIALGAEKVELYKDVKGIFSKDPIHDPQAFFYSQLSFDEALEIVNTSGGRVLHNRALVLAKNNALPLHVRSFLDLTGEGTVISQSNLKLAGAVYE